MRFFMHRCLPPRHRALLAIASALALAVPVRAQLAITEMMSSALKTNGMIISTNNSDFWELTNFGSNTVNLVGYYFSDDKNTLRSLPAVTMHANESVVFVRNNITLNATQFRSWWGSCVGSDVQIVFFPRPGFSSNGDSIRVYDPQGGLVDSVDFYQATRGVSFVYDTNSGAFGAFSVLGQGGTCQAATAADIASPGKTSGPIPLRITRQPVSQEACLGANITFKVSAVGMPRPRYQWYFNDQPIPGAREQTFTVEEVDATSAGIYRVVVTNGIAILHSSNAMLVIDTNLYAPSIATPPMSVTVVTNRAARFSVSACAFPAASYQWFSNGVPIANATDRTLRVPNCTLEMSGTEYCVRAANALGATSVCARLNVIIKPDLRFTEIQAYPSTDCNAHHDWFEVTNYGTNAVDLLGYRFSDEFSLAGAVVVTQSMVLQPAESAVFVKNPTADIFIDWWGADQLPPGLKVFPYGGFSLNKNGDALYLWNETAESADEAIDARSFSANTIGISQYFDYDFCYYGCDSVGGVFGAFRAQQCGDLGSPGYTANPPPRLLSIVRDGDSARVRVRTVEGKKYRLEYNTRLRPDGWIGMDDITAASSLIEMTDAAAASSQRFYRVREVLP